MDDLNREDLESLFGQQSGWCVSLYLPTHRSGSECLQDPIRLKNLVSDAESQLETVGVAVGDVQRLCEPARSLCDLDSDKNRGFWRRQADGLALFLSDARDVERFRLPEAFEELAVVAHRFHVKPLVRAIQRDQQYCVLAVSEKDVRFLEGSRTGLSARPGRGSSG